MAKKKSGTTYTSKGLYPTIGKRAPKAQTSEWDKMMNKFKAWQENRPVSDATLLAYGARNSAEQHRFAARKKGQ